MTSSTKTAFLNELKEIQETIVYQQLDDTITQEKLFEITHDTIVKVLEIIDGYHGLEFRLTDEKTGEELTENGNLHDLANTVLQG